MHRGMEARRPISFRIVPSAVFVFIVFVLLRAETVGSFDSLECGFIGLPAELQPIDCAEPQLDLAVVWTTHQRIMQAYQSEWPDSTYRPGMLDIPDGFEDYIDFVSFSRTQMDVRTIRRRGADTAYAWVVRDSAPDVIKTEIEAMINLGRADPSDSTFFKNADGVFYYFGRLVGPFPSGLAVGDFCPGGTAWAYGGGIGSINPSNGQYVFQQQAGSAAGYWQRIITHEVGHLFGLRHQPQSDHAPGNSCIGCIGCFGIMDLFLGTGCPRSGFGYVPYHPLHVAQLGWADLIPISRDTTLYVRDFRIRPLMYTIAPKTGYTDMFAMVNLQATNYDSVIAGEGLQITHAVDKGSNPPPGWDGRDIWDVEVPRGMFEPNPGTRCPAIPHVANSVIGVDTLQCMRLGDDSHLWPWGTQFVLGHGYNPSSALYAPSAQAPYDSQGVITNLRLAMTSLADSSVAGLKMIRVGVDFDYTPPPPDPDEPGQGGRGAPTSGDASQGVRVVPMSLSGSVEFDITGDIRSLQDLTIYSTTGRVVCKIPLPRAPGHEGHFQVLWGGIDGRGGKVASGAYFYAIEGKSQTAASGKFLFIR